MRSGLQSQIDSNDTDIANNASDIDDNEFRIAAAAADMGFVTSTVGSVDNVPTHPGYDGADYIGADDDMVAADMALDAALKANADADALLAADVDQNEADSDAADAAIQADVDQNEADSDDADAAIQEDVDQNEADSDAADAAMQADINQNEADSDAADTAMQADIDQNEALMRRCCDSDAATQRS